MSPERRGGVAPSPKADAYSLAALLYLLITGQRPTGAVPRPSTFELDPRLDELFAEALQARLRLWLPGFCAAVRAEDRTGFWAGAAALLLAALDHNSLTTQPEERTV